MYWGGCSGDRGSQAVKKMKCSAPLSLYCVYVVVNIARVFLGQFVRYLESPASLSERAIRILRTGVQNASRAMREVDDNIEVVKYFDDEGKSASDVVRVFASLIEAVKSTFKLSETDDCYVDVGNVKNLDHLQSIMPEIPRYFEQVRREGTEREKKDIDSALLQTLWYVVFVVQLGFDETSGDKRPKPVEAILRRLAASANRAATIGNWQEDYYCSLVSENPQRAIDMAKKLDNDKDAGQGLMDAYLKCGGWKTAKDLNQFSDRLSTTFGGSISFKEPDRAELASRNFEP